MISPVLASTTDCAIRSPSLRGTWIHSRQHASDQVLPGMALNLESLAALERVVNGETADTGELDLGAARRAGEFPARWAFLIR